MDDGAQPLIREGRYDWQEDDSDDEQDDGQHDNTAPFGGVVQQQRERPIDLRLSYRCGRWPPVSGWSRFQLHRLSVCLRPVSSRCPPPRVGATEVRALACPALAPGPTADDHRRVRRRARWRHRNWPTMPAVEAAAPQAALEAAEAGTSHPRLPCPHPRCHRPHPVRPPTVTYRGGLFPSAHPGLVVPPRWRCGRRDPGGRSR